MPPNFHRQIQDVSVAIYLLDVAIHSSILYTCPFAMTLMLLRGRDQVCFPTPWSRAWPCQLLWPMGNLHMWRAQRPGKPLGTGAHVLLLSLVSWECHGKKLDILLRMTGREGQRWTLPDKALFGQPACQLLRDQSEAILDHPTADERAQTNTKWEEISVHFKLWSFGLVCLLQSSGIQLY